MPGEQIEGQEQLGEEQTQSEGGGEPSPEILAQASIQGWVPKDKYTGDPAKWVDAATFVERGRNFTKNLKKELETVKGRLAQLDQNSKAFKAFHDRAMASQKAELETALAQLKREHREAIRDGDDDAADALEGRMETLNKEKEQLGKQPVEEPGKPGADDPHPEMQAWIEDGNQWFVTDAKLQAYATATAQELVAKGETARGRALLDKVTEIVKEDFPAKFSNPNRQRAGAAEAGSPAAQGRAGKTEKDLPEEDRALMNQFIAEGWTTKEKFLKEYRW